MRAILFGSPASPYSHGMDNVTLPPELERFATEAVAAGRYRDVSDVVAAGVSLLQRQEQARAELLASVLAAKEESERGGYLNGDEVAEQVRATIARRTNAAA
jgi:putative addiction module CopG family antidote